MKKRQLGNSSLTVSAVDPGCMGAEHKFGDDDFRSQQPRFAAENREANQVFVEVVNRVAATKTATSAQVALAWLLAQKPWIVPIPGTTKLHRVEENIGSVELELDAGDLAQIEAGLAGIRAQGDRYPPANAAYTPANSPTLDQPSPPCERNAK